MLKKNIIFFAKVDLDYIRDWEYYNNDIVMLKSFYKNVFICNSYFNFILLFFKEKNSDIFCWWWHSSLPIVLFSRLFGRIVFCTGAIHMFDYSGAPDFYKRSFLYKISNKISLKFATYNLFISKDQFLSITSHLNVNNPIILYSSLSFNYKKNEIVNNYQNINNPNDFNFLYFSWLTASQVKRKGLFHLIDAFYSLLKLNTCHATLTIAGKDGGFLNEIKHYIKNLEIEKYIIFKINVTEGEKIKLYQDSDLLISPSFMEGFGNASLEAMSYGCPVLISRYGASCEVTGNTGYIINEISSKHILDCLINYTSLCINQRSQMRKNAFARANHEFSFEKRVANFRNILNLK